MTEYVFKVSTTNTHIS